MIKVKQFYQNIVEIELTDSRRIKSPPRVVHGYIFNDIDEQSDKASELRKNHYHDIPNSQIIYIYESDIQEIEPIDIEI
jgi:hypothetical protein